MKNEAEGVNELLSDDEEDENHKNTFKPGSRVFVECLKECLQICE